MSASSMQPAAIAQTQATEEPEASMQSDIDVGIQACPDSQEVDVQTIREVKEICVQVRPNRKNALNKFSQE